MTGRGQPPLLVEPVISWPHEAEAGKSYLMTIDLRRAPGSAWPFEDQEEVTVRCMLETAPLFESRLLSQPAVVLHRFGGTYGPARYLLTATSEQARGQIWLTLSNRWDVPVQVIELQASIVPAGSQSSGVAVEAQTMLEMPTSEHGLDFRMLGPLEVELDGRWVRLGPMRRLVLAVLLLAEGRTVPNARLARILWGDPPPEAALATLRSHIARLRGDLGLGQSPGEGTAWLIAGEAGYRLHFASKEQVDTFRFQRLLEEGSEALGFDPSAAAAHLHAALALWRGPVLADVVPLAKVPFASDEIERLERLRNLAQRKRIEADLALGRHAEVADELQRLVSAHPDEERLCSLLALALYRSGQIGAAANVCKDAIVLLDQKGLTAPELQQLQRNILARAPGLDWHPPQSAPKPGAPPQPRRPFQLPPGITEFTGRRMELADLRARLSVAGHGQTSAIVISAVNGKPGVGKSALVVHLAHEVAERFPDGVLYADLRGAEPDQPTSPLRVLGQFLRALGVANDQVPAELDAAAAIYRSLLASKRILVVLDNAANAAQVRPLLAASPTCSVLITSRAPLGDLQGASLLALDLLPEQDAAVLLAHLAGQDRVGLDAAATRRVVQYCGRLPLALRIAGSKLASRQTWTIADLAARLANEQSRLAELQVGDLDVRASFALSYQDLTPPAARTFRRLGLLDCPDTTPSVAAALAEVTTQEAEVLLERLLDAQLLDQVVRGRYRFHDLLRLFARRQAEAEEDEAERRAALRRAFGWYLDEATLMDGFLDPRTDLKHSLHGEALDRFRADPATFRTTMARTALQWFEEDNACLLAAVRQGCREGFYELSWKLAYRLGRFYDSHKHWSDWLETQELGLAAARQVGDRPGEAMLLNNLGTVCRDLQRFDQSVSCYEESLAIWRDLGDRHQQGRVLNNLGKVYADKGQPNEAISLYKESLALRRELGDRSGEGISLSNLGVVYRELGRFDEAIDCLQQDLEICRNLGDRQGEGLPLMELGVACREMGRFEEASDYLEQSLAVRREFGDKYSEGLTLMNLGIMSRDQGDYAQASTYLRQARGLFTELGAHEREEAVGLLMALPPKDGGRV